MCMWKVVRIRHFFEFSLENGVETCKPATEMEIIGEFETYEIAKIIVDKQPRNCLYDTLTTYTYQLRRGP